MNRVRLTRVYRFEAAHRLMVPTLGPEENWEIYGKCSREGGHGHNYEVEVTLEGEPEPITGFLAVRDQMDREVRERLVDRCDHRDLNRVLPDVVTTGENLALAFFEWLAPAFSGRARLVRVRVFETPRNAFEASVP